jgi:hypothetical protein
MVDRNYRCKSLEATAYVSMQAEVSAKESGGSGLCEHGKQSAIQGLEAAVCVSMADRKGVQQGVQATVYVNGEQK